MLTTRGAVVFGSVVTELMMLTVSVELFWCTLVNIHKWRLLQGTGGSVMIGQ